VCETRLGRQVVDAAGASFIIARNVVPSPLAKPEAPNSYFWVFFSASITQTHTQSKGWQAPGAHAPCLVPSPCRPVVANAVCLSRPFCTNVLSAPHDDAPRSTHSTTRTPTHTLTQEPSRRRPTPPRRRPLFELQTRRCNTTYSSRPPAGESLISSLAPFDSRLRLPLSLLPDKQT